MNNRETIEQVERGYRMANPAHILYPESKTHPKEIAVAQANVYKVPCRMCTDYGSILTVSSPLRLCSSAGTETRSRGRPLSS
jgi:hypothetical protein